MIFDDSSYVLSFTSLIIGLILIVLSYQSKCNEFILCYGLLTVKRDVIIEQKIDIYAWSRK